MSWIITPRNTLPLATGGDTVSDIFIDGRMYRIHQFTTVGSSALTVIRGGDFEYLIVAGGGGSGRSSGSATGGGGAGGLLHNVGATPLLLTTGSVSVVVGAGGAGRANTSLSVRSANGNNSSFGDLIAIGGGAGGAENTNSTGANGGSGGGGSTSSAGGSGTAGQGNAGGSNWGRGGGAGQSGGDGGKGLLINITGTPTYYAGGGQNPFSAASVLGGGGRGEGSSGSELAADGAPNTGGGAGGRWGQVTTGRNGGSGIVIIRYAIS